MIKTDELQHEIEKNIDEFSELIKEIDNTSYDFGYRIAKLEERYKDKKEVQELIELIVALNDISRTNDMNFREALEKYNVKSSRIKTSIINHFQPLVDKVVTKGTPKSTVKGKLSTFKIRDYQIFLGIIAVILFLVIAIFNPDKIIKGIEVYEGAKINHVIKDIK